MGKVLFIACTPVARQMVEEIRAQSLPGVEICGVVNLHPRAAIGKANYDSYIDLAVKYDLPLFYCDNVNDAECLAWIREKEPDVIIQSGWSQKFLPELLAIPRYGCIGEHPAPLPRGRGAACVNWAILTGETHWGDTFFKMVSEYDKGEIYAQAFFEIAPHDDVATVYAKVAAASARTVREHLADWTSGVFRALPNDDAGATYFKKRRPADGLFDFDRPLSELYNFIRAQARPYPGAFFVHGGQKITVWRAAPTDLSSLSPAGSWLGATGRGGALVAVAGGSVIELLRLQPEGAPEQWGADWYGENFL